MKSDAFEKAGLGFVAVVILAVIGLIIGYFLNIADLFAAPALAEWTVIEIIRVVGVFVMPLGGVMGWF